MRFTVHRIFKLVFGFFTVFVSSLCMAHEVRPAVVDLSITEQAQYRISIRLNLEAIIADIGPEHDDTSESVNADKYTALRALSRTALREVFDKFQPRFLERITFRNNHTRISPDVIDIVIPDTGDVELARDAVIVLGGQLPFGTESVSWGWAESFGANALRVSTHSSPELYTVYLQGGEMSEAIPLRGAIHFSAWKAFANYIAIGFQHIIPKGLDHILFVIGLFLLSMKLRPLIWQVTSFTVAHSVTLALGILGIVQIPASIVEPLIALSIVYVCIENILSDKLHSWRPLIVFSFGLLHGLGFASVLTEVGLSTTHFVAGLVAFNIGIELAQLSVIALCVLTVGAWFSHKDWYRKRISIPASAMIAMVGGYWFIERIF